MIARLFGRALVASALFAVALIVPHSQNANAATLTAQIDLSSQRMSVYVEGKKKYTWRVSTGKKGWRTPTGYYSPKWRKRNYFEKKWNMELPYLVLISYDGIGIHGTTLTSRLGRTASHGCIRLSIHNASKFYKLVGLHGLWNTSVRVVP